ncbi:MAG TPA: M28 family metallopeptidase [Clostridia bacterium]|nr:M28 family metallopeptidase [Clostridia bacterium]
MNHRYSFLWVAVLMMSTGVAVAQQKSDAASSTNRPDAAVRKAITQVEAANLRNTVDKLVSFHTRHTLSVDMPPASGKGIAAARDWIRSEFERYSKDCGGCLDVRLDSFTEAPTERIPKPTELSNVYAVLRGTDAANAKRVYLITGHYDTRASETNDFESASPGANDDGSGVAVVLESARVLSKSKFPATIVFMAVAGEEQGLNGARHFAKMAKAEGWNVEAVLNDDTVGGDKSDPRQDRTIVRVFSEGIPLSANPQQIRAIRATGSESDSSSRQLARYIVDVGRQYLPARGLQPKMIFRSDRFLRGGDHTAFNEQGYAAVRFTEYRENYNHQHQNPRTENGIEYGDLPKFVDFDYAANVARLNVATLASLASAPAPPSQVRLLTKNLENDSTLRWEAAPGGLATAYEVLWRTTTSPTWDNVERVGSATMATIPRSKDNVIFAVRSVDSKGHRSLPVIPVPER